MNVGEVLLLLTGLTVLALILGLSWDHWSQQKHEREVRSASVLAALAEATAVARLSRELVEKLGQPEIKIYLNPPPTLEQRVQEIDWKIRNALASK